MKARFVNRLVGAFVVCAMSLVSTSGLVAAQSAPNDQQKPPQQQQYKTKNKKQQQAPKASAAKQQPAAVDQTQQPPPAAAKQKKQQPPAAAKRKKQQPPAAAKQKKQQPAAVDQTQQPPPPAAAKQKKQQPAAVAQKRLPPERQQQLIEQQRQRTTVYRTHLEEQERIAQQRADALRHEKRLAHYRFQQRYYQRLRQQRNFLVINERSYAYNTDPYYYTAPSYRYFRDGAYYETNRYGADLLRDAVNYGYAEGFEAGRADRQDRWGNGYEDSFAYQDANYGYRGYYVDQSEYNYYFRQGFRHGYEDGYNSRYHYGHYSKGKLVILASVLAGILAFESLD